MNVCIHLHYFRFAAQLNHHMEIIALRLEHVPLAGCVYVQPRVYINYGRLIVIFFIFCWFAFYRLTIKALLKKRKQFNFHNRWLCSENWKQFNSISCVLSFSISHFMCVYHITLCVVCGHSFPECYMCRCPFEMLVYSFGADFVFVVVLVYQNRFMRIIFPQLFFFVLFCFCDAYGSHQFTYMKCIWTTLISIDCHFTKITTTSTTEAATLNLLNFFVNHQKTDLWRRP